MPKIYSEKIIESLNTNTINRIYGLDILRAIAILLVVNIHSVHILPQIYADFISYYFRINGVNLFFVLSGFLIGTALIKLIEFNNQKENAFISLFRFLKRRWLRTLPNYYFILTILCLYQLIFNPQFDFTGIYKYIFFIQNLFEDHPPFLAEAWSLSVEEWFYFLFPVLLFCSIQIVKYSPKSIICFIAVIWIIIFTSYRLYNYYQQPILEIDAWGMTIKKQVCMRLDSSMFGILAAYLSYYFPIVWKRIKWSCLVLGLIILFVSRSIDIPLYKYVFLFVTESLGFALILPYFSSLRQGQGVLFKIFTFISVISYSLYLIHYTVIQAHILPHVTFLRLGVWGNYFLYWFLSIAVAYLLYLKIELPFLKLRNREALQRQ